MSNTPSHNTDYHDTAYYDTDYHCTDYHDTDYHDTAYHDTAYHNTDYHDTAYHDTAYHNTDYHNNDYHNTDYQDTVWPTCCHLTLYDSVLGLSMNRLVVHRNVFAREIYFPMEGGCQDPGPGSLFAVDSFKSSTSFLETNLKKNRIKSQLLI